VIVVSLFLLVLLMGLSELRGQVGAAPKGLSSLKFQTGWVLLGSFDVSLKEWGSAVHFKVINKREQAANIYVPMRGDILEVTANHEVHIVNFAADHEAHRLQSPAGQTDHKRNYTGVTLSPQSTVKVEEVVRSSTAGTQQLVWARVSPVTGDKK